MVVDSGMDYTGLREKLDSRTQVTDTGCWVWTGPLSDKGYGKIRWQGKIHRAHRLAYTAFGPEFDRTLTLDHLCRTRACWRPDHLEPVPVAVNNLRGVGWGAQNSRRTHCPQGHEYTPENTRLRVRAGERRSGTQPERDCMECRREYQRARRVALTTRGGGVGA